MKKQRKRDGSGPKRDGSGPNPECPLRQEMEDMAVGETVRVTANEDFPESALVSKKLGIKEEDYVAWMDGEGSSASQARCDKAVKKLLGADLYNAGEATARLVNILLVKTGLSRWVHPAHEVGLAKKIIKNPKKYANGFEG